MARLMGMRCISVIRDRPDFNQIEQKLLSLGSSMVVKAERLPLPETIAHIRQVMGGEMPSLALNCVGGQSATDLARLLAPNGCMVTYGGMSRRPLTISTGSLIFNNHTHRGFWLSSWYQQATPAERESMMSEIIGWIQQGKLTMPAISRLPLGVEAFKEQQDPSAKRVFWMAEE